MEATLGLTRPFAYGRGWPELVKVADPAAGAETSHVVPGDRVERLVTVHAKLKTSAAVATRLPILHFKDADGNTWAEFGPAGEVLKESELEVVWAVDLGYAITAAKGRAQLSIPDLLLRPGTQIVFGVDAIDKEDQLSALRLMVERWPNGPDGYPQGVEPTYIPPGLLA